MTATCDAPECQAPVATVRDGVPLCDACAVDYDADATLGPARALDLAALADGAVERLADHARERWLRGTARRELARRSEDAAAWDAWHVRALERAGMTESAAAARVTAAPAPAADRVHAEVRALRLELAEARRHFDVASAAHEAAELRIVELRAASRTPAAYRTAVSLGTTACDTPQPQLELAAPRGTSHRAVRAALHRLAAAAELETLARGADDWIVRVEHGRSDEVGSLVLELIVGDAAEAERGLKLLHAVAEAARW